MTQDGTVPDEVDVAQTSHTTGVAATPSRTPRQRRVRMYSWGVIVAMAIATGFAGWTASGAEAPAEVAGGDYPAFYGAGSIGRDGDWDRLYSFEAQAAAQAGLNETEGSAWFFAYPPPVAIPYVPLSVMPYVVSWLVHTALMAGFLAGAILLARPMIPWLVGHEVEAYAAVLLFWPMLRGINGGSNTALTMFLLVAVWRLVRDGREVAAGLALAALLYKPQYGLAPAGLLLLDRRPRLAGAFAAGAAAFYALAAVLLGPGWVGDWLDVARRFEEVDLQVNGQSASSFVAFAQNALGVGDPLAVAAGYGAAALVVIALVIMWVRRIPVSLDQRMALTIPGLLLLSPHTMSHDVGIVLITVAYLVGIDGRRSAGWLGAIWALGAIQVAMKVLGFSPGFFTLLVVAVWALRTLRPGRTPVAAAV